MRKLLLIVGSVAALALPFAANALGIQVMINGKAVVFSDVSESAWFSTYVRQSAEAGIVNGYKDVYGKLTGKFGPENQISIAEALKIAVEGAGYNKDDYGAKIESGVGDHWASAYVSVAKAENFPMTFTRANLNRSASRAEVAAIFAAAFQVSTDVSLENRYDDVSVSTPFATSIEALSEKSVISGDTDLQGNSLRRFRPLQSINRAEVAKIVITARTAFGHPGEGRKPSEQSQAQHIVTYTDAGFTPSVTRIKEGESVTFKNETTSSMWIASNPHPTHNDYPGFDSMKALGQGETYIFTFTKIGTWGFHNHLNSSKGGSVIVE